MSTQKLMQANTTNAQLISLWSERPNRERVSQEPVIASSILEQIDGYFEEQNKHMIQRG